MYIPLVDHRTKCACSFGFGILAVELTSSSRPRSLIGSRTTSPSDYPLVRRFYSGLPLEKLGEPTTSSNNQLVISFFRRCSLRPRPSFHPVRPGSTWPATRGALVSPLSTSVPSTPSSTLRLTVSDIDHNSLSYSLGHRRNRQDV